MRLGLHIGAGTLNLVEQYKDELYHLDTTATRMANKEFPKYTHTTIRAICATSLEGLRLAVDRIADDSEVTHLGYNPERRDCTPEYEWQNLRDSAAEASEIADLNGFGLLYGPGMRLALANRSIWPVLSRYTDAWYLQCQIFQTGDPNSFRSSVKDHVEFLRRPRKSSNRVGFRGPIVAQVSLTGCTPAEVYAYCMALNGVVNAVRLLHMRDLDKLAEVLALLYP